MTGRECERTHRIMDSFSSTKGSKHRNWLHDPISAGVVAQVFDGPHCVRAAWNHIFIDQAYDNPEYKIVFEMSRLADRAPSEPRPMILPGMAPAGRCRVRR